MVKGLLLFLFLLFPLSTDVNAYSSSSEFPFDPAATDHYNFSMTVDKTSGGEAFSTQGTARICSGNGPCNTWKIGISIFDPNLQAQSKKLIDNCMKLSQLAQSDPAKYKLLVHINPNTTPTYQIDTSGIALNPTGDSAFNLTANLNKAKNTYCALSTNHAVD